MRLSYRKVDRVAGYSTDIHQYLETDSGKPKRSYREAHDRQFDGDGTQKFNSLWGFQRR